MLKEIKRNNWSKFVRSFSANNKYRRVRVKSGTREVARDSFIGLELEKKGRLIDGFCIYTIRENNDSIAEPLISVKQPKSVELEKDDSGNDLRLSVKTGDGKKAEFILEGEKNPDSQKGYVEKIAYSLYERRGYNHGNDMSDWLVAESKLKEAESRFV